MNEALDFLIAHGLMVLGAVVLAEQVGLPLPAVPVLLAAGALAGAGKLSLLGSLTVAVAACFAGDFVWYELGRRRGRESLALLCRISFEPDSCVRRTETFFTAHGVRALVLAKFIPGLSTLAPALAGLFRVPLRTFALYNGAGAVVWAGTFIGAGYTLGHQLERVAAHAAWLGTMLAVLLGGGAVAYIGYKIVHRQWLLRELRMARISVEELSRLLEAGESVVILDLRQVLDPGDDGSLIPGAVRMSVEELERRHHEIPRDREVVLYCACPNDVTAARMALMLRRHGIRRVRPLAGGITAWRARGAAGEARPAATDAVLPAAR
jgi:membrane protein DedA with SNARE-associated domain/rhodanese-related sulfurtransferase